MTTRRMISTTGAEATFSPSSLSWSRQRGSCSSASLSGHLPVTELEVVALAFAALNIVTYAFWWNKPQNMGCAIRVQVGAELEDRMVWWEHKETWVTEGLDLPTMGR